MAKKRWGAEQILSMLRNVEVHLAKGLTVVQYNKKAGDQSRIIGPPESR